MILHYLAVGVLGCLTIAAVTGGLWCVRSWIRNSDWRTVGLVVMIVIACLSVAWAIGYLDDENRAKSKVESR